MAELLGSTETASDKTQGALTADTDLSALLTAILGDSADVHDIAPSFELPLPPLKPDVDQALEAHGPTADSAAERTSSSLDAFMALDSIASATASSASAFVEASQAIDLAEAAIPPATTELLVGPLREQAAAVPASSIGHQECESSDAEIGRQLDGLLLHLQASDGALSAATAVASTAPVARELESSTAGPEVTSVPATHPALSKKRGSRAGRHHKRAKGAWVVTAPPSSVASSTPAATNRKAHEPRTVHGDPRIGQHADVSENGPAAKAAQSAGEPDLRAVDGRLGAAAQSPTTGPFSAGREGLFAGTSDSIESGAATSVLSGRLPMMLAVGLAILGLLVWLAMRQAA